jgi:hypothetical protein
MLFNESGGHSDTWAVCRWLLAAGKISLLLQVPANEKTEISK